MACATFVRRFIIPILALGMAVAHAQTLTKACPNGQPNGDGQLVVQQIGQGKPLCVLVRDASGNPLPNVKVAWAVGNTSLGIIQPLVPTGASTPGTTDSKGYSSANFIAIPPPVNESYTQGSVTATYSGASVTFTETSVGEAIAGISNIQAFPNPLPTAANLKGAAGQKVGKILVQFQVTNGPQNGQFVANAGVSVTMDNPSNPATIACTNNPVFSASTTGIAECDLVFGGKIGAGSFTLSTGGLQNFDYQYQVIAGAPDTIAFLNGNNSSGVPGQQITLTAQLSDIGGNQLSGIPMTWSVVAPGVATLSSTSGPTDNTGRISTQVTLGNTSGPLQVQLSTASGVTTQTGTPITALFNLSVNVVVAGMNKISGDGQSVLENIEFPNPLLVQVNDAKNNPVAGASVAFAVTSGSATLSSPNATTGSNGQASTFVTAGADAGPVVITASTAAGTAVISQIFNLTVIPPGPVCDTDLTKNDTFFNGANYVPNFISPGGIALIYCSGIADSIQGVVTSNDFGFGPLPEQVQGVTVQFNPPSGPYAPIYYLANQNGKQWVAIQVPFDILGSNPSGTLVPVTVMANGNANIGTLMAPIMAAAPGFLETVMSDNKSRAILIRSTGELVDLNHKAKPGETLTAFLTGLIPPTDSSGNSVISTDEFAPIGSDVTITTPIIFGVGGRGTPVPPTAKYADNLIGVWEVTFVVPTDAKSGDQVLALAVPDPTNNGKLIGTKHNSTVPIQ